MVASGGIENWESIKTIRYDKAYKLFTVDGTIEQDVVQQHYYTFNPLTIEIISVMDSTETITRLNDGVYSRTVNGDTVDVSQEALKNSINASFYVYSFPFNLQDDSPERTYLGEQTLLDTLTTNAIAYQYPGSKDKWTFYTDLKSGKVVANLVNRPDHNSLVLNDSFQQAGGILWYQDRSSYRVDENNEILYLRATYQYENFEVTR